LISSDQATQHTKASACEKVPFSDASAVVVQWSICLLTLVENDMLSAADRNPLTSLQHTQQQQSASAHFMSYAINWYSVHVAACH